MRYAQINSNGVCFAESFLSEEVDAEDMILLTDDEPSPLGKRYVNGVWEEVEKEEMPQPPSDSEIIMQSISELELQNFEAQQERRVLAQQMVDLELAVLEGGNGNV
ncbi:hypothetical protein [Clostridium sp. MD294]|uniref:hypothetical protein n=1 Tax=Clostridium sp. MD294 TaxID=97138 RepID=UPI0002CB285A|nr:hypothetical protein [Clostridium sp. MD294]NDO45813.1 hypothetical protein [Clostridium sp. MD294]USF30532.1 hypothetical protein C820_001973 [Clostridium sp. MD294]